MLKLLLLLVAQPQFVECGCLCLNGVGKTLCQSVSEAKREANVCPADLRCPVPEHDPEAALPEYFDAPDEHAHNCREVRVWDAAMDAYAGVKVCDVITG